MTRCSALRKTRTCVRAMAQLSATHGRHALASRYGTPPIPAITICSMTLRLTPCRSFIASTLDNHPHMLRLMNGLAARGAADVVLARPGGALPAEERAQREVPAQRLCARSACAVPLRVRHLHPWARHARVALPLPTQAMPRTRLLRAPRHDLQLGRHPAPSFSPLSPRSATPSEQATEPAAGTSHVSEGGHRAQPHALLYTCRACLCKAS